MADITNTTPEFRGEKKGETVIPWSSCFILLLFIGKKNAFFESPLTPIYALLSHWSEPSVNPIVRRSGMRLLCPFEINHDSATGATGRVYLPSSQAISVWNLFCRKKEKQWLLDSNLSFLLSLWPSHLRNVCCLLLPIQLHTRFILGHFYSQDT